MVDYSSYSGSGTDYLSYSGYKTYSICPRKYQLSYIIKPDVVIDPTTSLYGSALGKVMEWFYNRSFWNSDNPVEVSKNSIKDAIKESLSRFPDYNNHSYINELNRKLHDSVPTCIEIIRSNKLISRHSWAEVDLSSTFKHKSYDFELKIGGKADFCHSNDKINVSLFDGKSSIYRDKYTDPVQVIWYSFLYYSRNGVYPNQIGFIYWSFPEDPISYISYSKDDVKRLLNDIFNVANKIRESSFPTKPSSECKLCDYRPVCPEGNEYFKLNLQKKTILSEEEMGGLDVL